MLIYPDSENPYGQHSLPYQPDQGRTDTVHFKQQEFSASYSTNQPGESFVPSAQYTHPSQEKPAASRLSKAEALAFVSACKKWLVAGSLVTFVALSALVAGHITGAASNQVTPASNSNTNSTSPSYDNNGNYNNNDNNNGGFFRQGGGNGFGNSANGQSPISGSHSS
jgi:hypothetical protein